MCGIAGLIGGRPPEPPCVAPEAVINRMIASMEHRGPDGSGTWQSPDGAVHLGHRRLAVLDLSPAARQPMVDIEAGLALVFNGEIYGFHELRRELEGAGERFCSSSDTEVILAGYRRWGAGVVDRLVGMFAFAIVDLRQRLVLLARDRAGEKPLYWAPLPAGRGVAFASELGALEQVPGIGTEIDTEAIALYLRYQYIPAPRSVWRGIHKLPPAHTLTLPLDGGAIPAPRCYWDPIVLAARPGPRLDGPDATFQIRAALKQAVSDQMVADVPVGAFLSGGIDSTVVVALMCELARGPVRTFTIRFEDQAFDESVHARAVARHLGTDHTEQTLTAADALRLVPKLPSLYGEPFADASALPTYLVSSLAREHVTVSLSGDGGDEAFGGYPRYDLLDRAVWPARLARPLAPLLRPAGQALAKVDRTLGRRLDLLTRPLPEIYRHTVTAFDAATVRQMCGCDPSLEPFDRAWNATGAPGLAPRRRAMLADTLTYLPGSVLTKIDRAAMAVSLETRAPLLDHRLLELALRLPRVEVVRKRILRSIAYERVPRALIDRPKMGFEVPLGRWLRGPLKEPLIEALRPTALAKAGIGDTAPLERMADEHLRGASSHLGRLWTILVLSQWIRQRGSHRRRGEALA